MLVMPQVNHIQHDTRSRWRDRRSCTLAGARFGVERLARSDERHYDEQQSGGPLTEDDLRFGDA